MTSGFDLEAYFERIGFSGSPEPTLDSLEEIHLRHAQSIPFENLNPLLRWPVRLDAASLQQKLIRDRRGGYCFEQNLLLSHALTAIGFDVTGLAARVLWNAAPDAVAPRGHMLMLIDLDGRPYIADVGFGGLTLTKPLRLEHGIEQPTPHEPFRLVRTGGTFHAQARVNGGWKLLYRFDLQEQLLPDYEVTNWYLSNHPDSHFVKGLVAARPDAGRRFALRNNELAVHHVSGATERHRLTTPGELRHALEHDLRVELPDTPELGDALERLTARAA